MKLKILSSKILIYYHCISVLKVFICVFLFSIHKAAILCSVLTHSDEFLITGTYDRLVNVIRIENGDLVHSLEKHFDAVTALAISLDDSILVSGRIK